MTGQVTVIIAITRSKAKEMPKVESDVDVDGIPDLVTLYKRFNEELFNNRIPGSFIIVWGRRMTGIGCDNSA